MRLQGIVARALLIAWSASPTLAGEAVVKNDGSITWQAGVDGVEIEWNPDGSVGRLYSRYSTPVEFQDRRGIAKAQIIAEEKAKANIVRFMSQSSSAARMVGEVQADVNKATQQRQTGSAAVVKKIDERTIVESLTEVTASFAAGTLRGVIVLEKGYDDKTQEAWAVVGISEKTIGAARNVKTMIDERPHTSPSRAPTDMGVQGGEIRRSRQRDW